MTNESNNSVSLMGPAEVGKYLGVAERTIYMWAQQKKIPAFKVGSVWRFRREDVDTWLESNRSGPSVDPTQPLTPYVEPNRSNWRIRKDEEEATQAITDACKAYIESTLKMVGRETFTVEQFDDRFGKDIVKKVIKILQKEKIITINLHEGLNGEKVQVIKKRS